MNKCCYALKVDTTNFLNPAFHFPKITEQNLQNWLYSPKEILSEEWIGYTRTLGLNWVSAVVFWKRANLIHSTAHLDVFTDITKVCQYGINIAIGGKDSVMMWYELPDGSYPIKYTPNAGTPYTNWPVSMLTEVERSHVGNNLTLVRTGIPHEVNTGVEDRWCISLRLSDMAISDWNEIVSNFRSRNLIEE